MQGIEEDLRRSFLDIVAEVVAPPGHPDLHGFRVTSVRVFAGYARVEHTGAPDGPRVDPCHGYSVDRRLVVDAAALVMARRAGRLDAGERREADDREWVDEMEARFPGWFACEVSCGAGWADLLFAMAERVEAERPGRAFRFEQVKEKYGTLRAYHVGANPRIDAIVDAFEVVSGAVCERCGAPGSPRRTAGGYHHTACDRHAQGPRPTSEGEGSSW